MRVVYEPDIWEMRGEQFPYVHIAFRDDDNDEQFTTTESDMICFDQVANQYREKHGIPYTDEIVALRERYGVSATKMAQILGFGANQYRLYEMGEVPSESNGKMIRSAMNPKVFLDLVQSSRNLLTEKDLAKITARVEDVIASSVGRQDEQWESARLFQTRRGLVNGFAPQSLGRLKNLLLYVLEQMGETFQTKMNKVLFYIDFLSYRERGMAISGLVYQAMEFGPVPQRWDRVYSAFDEVEQQIRLVQGQECLSLLPGGVADMRCFTAAEKAIIDRVCAKMKDMTSRAASKMSHEEILWKDHVGKPETIPFCEAFSLMGV
jgi:DNA-binding transcriptional regulator YiaG